jgi:hypothetical protein
VPDQLHPADDVESTPEAFIRNQRGLKTGRDGAYDLRPGYQPVTDDVPPAAKNLALAYRLAQMIDKGLLADFTAAARLIGVSQPRLTHVMGLLLLAPQLQEAILFGTVTLGDKQLRRLARMAAWPDQLAALSAPWRIVISGRQGLRASANQLAAVPPHATSSCRAPMAARLDGMSCY